MVHWVYPWIRLWHISCVGHVMDSWTHDYTQINMWISFIAFESICCLFCVDIPHRNDDLLPSESTFAADNILLFQVHDWSRRNLLTSDRQRDSFDLDVMNNLRFSAFLLFNFGYLISFSIIYFDFRYNTSLIITMWNQSQGGGFMNNTVSSPRFVEISIASKCFLFISSQYCTLI